MNEKEAEIYWAKEKLDEVFRIYDSVEASGKETPIAPNIVDLVRLHSLIRSRSCQTVIEFGVGFSTVVIADALLKNERERKSDQSIRNRFPFQCFSVDASESWIYVASKRLPSNLADRVHFVHSEVQIGLHLGQLCHFYESLPDVVPDFVYLDGPDPKDVKGSVGGLSFQCEERTVMSADLLRMESTLLPGMMILADGRTNNVRFLERNFTRSFRMDWDRDGDVTTFELVEEPLRGSVSESA